jgi:hypothetical protein
VVTTFCSPEEPELYVVAKVEEQASEYLKQQKNKTGLDWCQGLCNVI